MDMTKIKTAVAEQHAGGTVKLAEVFGIRPQSVSGWGEHLPLGRAFELKAKRPQWFNTKGGLRAFK